MVWPWDHRFLLSANFYMADYEKAALESAPLKPRSCFRYVEDNFVIWQHGPDKWKDFLHHLNSIHQAIQFTMETQSEGHLPLLDLDIYRRPDVSLSGTQSVPLAHSNQSVPERQVQISPIQ
jgi:hypothetical protein